MDSLLTAALGYADLKSWRVFPVGSDKAPLVSGGFKSASRDPRIIREWWRQYPEAGIGFPVPEGVLVVDVDPRNGGVTPVGLPETLTASTRSAGAHHYFAAPAGLTFIGQASPGVDLKSAGKGYVILPPTPGYVWTRKGPMTPLPESYVDRWKRVLTPFRLHADAKDTLYVPWEDGTRYGLVALNNQLGNILTAENGDRNRTLYKAAVGLYSLVAGGELSEDYADKQLYSAALEVGLEDVETVRTLQSAKHRGFEEPRRAND